MAVAGKKAKYLFSPSDLVESRQAYMPGYSYKTGEQNGYFGMDVHDGASDIDEANMAFSLPFADGNRRDGVGDLLEIGGIDTSRHRVNPICYLDHAKSCFLPIGLAEDPATKAYTVFLDTVAKQATLKCFMYQGKGMDGVDKRADNDHAVLCEQLFDLVVKKYLRGGSIGYQVISAYPLQADYQKGIPQGMHLLKTLMLEGSLVVMPCNQDTVRKALCLTKVCGKPLSPVLVKSLAPYAGPKKAQMGYQKAVHKPLVDAYLDNSTDQRQVSRDLGLATPDADSPDPDDHVMDPVRHPDYWDSVSRAQDIEGDRMDNLPIRPQRTEDAHAQRVRLRREAGIKPVTQRTAEEERGGQKSSDGLRYGGRARVRLPENIDIGEPAYDPKTQNFEGKVVLVRPNAEGSNRVRIRADQRDDTVGPGVVLTTVSLDDRVHDIQKVPDKKAIKSGGPGDESSSTGRRGTNIIMRDNGAGRVTITRINANGDTVQGVHPETHEIVGRMIGRSIEREGGEVVKVPDKKSAPVARSGQKDRGTNKIVTPDKGQRRGRRAVVTDMEQVGGPGAIVDVQFDHLPRTANPWIYEAHELKTEDGTLLSDQKKLRLKSLRSKYKMAFPQEELQPGDRIRSMPNSDAANGQTLEHPSDYLNRNTHRGVVDYTDINPSTGTRYAVYRDDATNQFRVAYDSYDDVVKEDVPKTKSFEEEQRLAGALDYDRSGQQKSARLKSLRSKYKANYVTQEGYEQADRVCGRSDAIDYIHELRNRGTSNDAIAQMSHQDNIESLDQSRAAPYRLSYRRTLRNNAEVPNQEAEGKHLKSLRAKYKHRQELASGHILDEIDGATGTIPAQTDDQAREIERRRNTTLRQPARGKPYETGPEIVPEQKMVRHIQVAPIDKLQYHMRQAGELPAARRPSQYGDLEDYNYQVIHTEDDDPNWRYISYHRTPDDARVQAHADVSSIRGNDRKVHIHDQIDGGKVGGTVPPIESADLKPGETESNRGKSVKNCDRGGQEVIPQGNPLNRQNVPPARWVPGAGAQMREGRKHRNDIRDAYEDDPTDAGMSVRRRYRTNDPEGFPNVEDPTPGHEGELVWDPNAPIQEHRFRKRAEGNTVWTQGAVEYPMSHEGDVHSVRDYREGSHDENQRTEQWRQQLKQDLSDIPGYENVRIQGEGTKGHLATYDDVDPNAPIKDAAIRNGVPMEQIHSYRIDPSGSPTYMVRHIFSSPPGEEYPDGDNYEGTIGLGSGRAGDASRRSTADDVVVNNQKTGTSERTLREFRDAGALDYDRSSTQKRLKSLRAKYKKAEIDQVDEDKAWHKQLKKGAKNG